MRYRTASGPQAEYEPGSRGRVLRNRLGVKQARMMARQEYEALLRARAKYLGIITEQTRFTAAILCRMHKDWLGNLYEWAGQYRTVEVRKGGFAWPPAYLVEHHLRRLEEAQLRRCTPCRPGPLPHVARTMAEVHGELLLIHPFREGNGRLARWLADLMALQAARPMPDYGFTGRVSRARRRQYLEAVQRAYWREDDLLAAFFAESLVRGERLA